MLDQGFVWEELFVFSIGCFLGLWDLPGAEGGSEIYLPREHWARCWHAAENKADNPGVLDLERKVDRS